MLGVGVSLTSRTGPPGWVTPGASADLRFKDGLYYAAAPRALADIPGETSSGGVNGTVVRDGVIVPATEQNLLTYSEDFTDAAWSKSGVTVSGNQAVAPNGILDADKLVEASGVSPKVLTVVPSISSAIYTFSVYAKAAERSWLITGWPTSNNAAWFDISAGVVGTTQTNITDAQIENVGDGWYRCKITTTVGSDPLRIYVADQDNNAAYDGDGSSGIYVWGAQLREARYSDTYVPTTSAAITRAAPRIGDDGLLVEGAATNKCQAFAAPTDLTGITKSGDAAAVLSVVDDTAELEAAGLAEITGGKAYKLDNTAGSGSAFANVSEAVGNLNTHTASAYIRASDSTGRIGIGGSSSGATTSYTRLTHTQTPSSTSNTCYIGVSAGAVVYFVLPQLEEGSTATSYIPTEGSSVTRTADSVTLTDLDALGLTSAVLGELDTPLDDDFTSYADQAAAETAGWVFGTGTTLDAANNQIDYSAAADATAVRKTLSLVAGVEYEVEMVVSNYVGGGLRVFVGGAVVVSTASANGTFTGTFTASATSPFMDLRATDVTTASIDSITIRRAEPLGGYTVVVEAEHNTTGSFYAVWSLNDGTSSEELYLTSAPNGGDNAYVYGRGSGANVDLNLGDGSWPAGQVAKVAVRVKNDDFGASINGGTVVADSFGTVVAFSRLSLGERASGVSEINGHIRRLTIIPRAVSDAELQSLSS